MTSKPSSKHRELLREMVLGEKGQAFDTFKLMIAAVIAVAILGILLGILGSIQPPGGDPATITGDQLSKAYQFPGSIFASASKASFKSGVTYVSDSFKDKVGGLATINFYCGTRVTQVWKATKAGGSSSVAITGNFQATIKTKCTGSSSSAKCCVGIGDDADLATQCK